MLQVLLIEALLEQFTQERNLLARRVRHTYQ
jgi:hypothetical protein